MSTWNTCSTFQCRYMYSECSGQGTHRIQSGRKLMLSTRARVGHHQPQCPGASEMVGQCSRKAWRIRSALPLPHRQAADVKYKTCPVCSSISGCQSLKTKSECDVPL